MAGTGIGNLVDISRRALFTNTQAVRVIGSNIANVNTPGYSRRNTEIVTEDPVSFGQDAAAGTGSKVNTIIRQTDKFLNREFLIRITDRAKQEIRDNVLSRAEAPFSLDNTAGKVGFELSEFFSALDDLSLNPSDQGLRNRILLKGQSLTQAINSTYDTLASLQREADDRLSSLVGDVNSEASQIAELNSQIAITQSSGQENLSLQDKRDELLRKLAGKISFSTIDNPDGTITLSLENGFTLVSGATARQIEFTQTPSFAPAGGFPPALDGGALGHIVFNFGNSTTPSPVDLTRILAAGGGEIGGLLGVRGVQTTADTSPFDASGDIIDLASRVESLARDLLIRFNTSYLGNVDEDSSTAAFDASSGDLTGSSPPPFGLFSVSGASDVDLDGLPAISDLTSSTSFSNYASRIEFQVTDPNRLAAALDLDNTDNLTSFAPGDSSNIQNLAALRNESVDYSIYGVGSFSLLTTIEKLYQSTVSSAGTKAQDAKNQLSIAGDRESQIRELQQSISGVSLDEEFAQLINYQRAFEASARMVRIGDELTGEILSLLGG